MTTDALALMMSSKALTESREDENKIPEPEFKPFRFPKKEAAAVRSRPVTPANVAREPRTLEELGVPGPLAREMETTFRVMGLTRDDRVIGYTFTAPDGTRHALRLATVPGRDATGLAA